MGAVGCNRSNALLGCEGSLNPTRKADLLLPHVGIAENDKVEGY